MTRDAAQLVSKPRSPNTVHFRAIYEQGLAYVWRSLRNLGVQGVDLEDAAHDVFVAVHRHLPDYDPSRPIRPWLFGFCAGVAANYRRLARHHREFLTDSTTGLLEDSMAEDRGAAREAQELVTAALDQIDLDRRAVFVLHDLDGYSMSEVATALSIPMFTGYSRLRQARAEFAAAVQRLERQGGGRS